MFIEIKGFSAFNADHIVRVSPVQNNHTKGPVDVHKTNVWFTIILRDDQFSHISMSVKEIISKVDHFESDLMGGGSVDSKYLDTAVEKMTELRSRLLALKKNHRIIEF